MEKEDKELILFKGISAMVPYGVKCLVSFKDGTKHIMTLRSGLPNSFGNYDFYNERYSVCSNDFKMYLRPLSSMTEEEKWDFGRIFNTFGDLNLDLLEDGLCFQELYDITGRCNITWDELNTAINWLNSHHFDYRGLIHMGLAIEVTEENNPYK